MQQILILSLALIMLQYGHGHAGVDAIHDHNQKQKQLLGIETIYQFGDSLADTGNFIREIPNGFQSSIANLPYGINFFNHPTGRCSDGFLIIDYFARFFKLPFLDPYLKKDGDFTHGVNFAVVGATALDTATLAAKNISLPITNSSLSVQLNWFKSHLASTCTTSIDCKRKLRKALFVMGEIGGNDLNNAILQGKSMEDLQNLVPDVVQEIKDAVNEVIELGAVRVLIPGNFPIGCMTIYLARFSTDDPTMYDELKCLKAWNELAKFQNDYLKQAIKELQRDHPYANIIYGDYYNALRAIVRDASQLGFDEEEIQRACCGSGENAYNFNLAKMCGANGTQVCQHPGSHISWDGIHLTSHAYQHMSYFLLNDIIRS